MGCIRGICLQYCVYIYIYVQQCLEMGFVTVPPPLLQTFVAGPLLQTLVAGLCVEYCSLHKACRREGLSQNPRFCYKPCRKKAARACYKPDVFEALPYPCIFWFFQRSYSIYSRMAVGAPWKHIVTPLPQRCHFWALILVGPCFQQQACDVCMAFCRCQPQGCDSPSSCLGGMCSNSIVQDSIPAPFNVPLTWA